MNKILKLILLTGILTFFGCEKFIMNNDKFTGAGASGNKDYIVLESDGIMVQKNDLTSGSDWQTAYEMCEDSHLGNFTDWRLPTRAELGILYNKRQMIGGFSTGDFYWSSDFDNYEEAYFYYSFYDGKVYSYGTDYCRCRAVRSLP